MSDDLHIRMTPDVLDWLRNPSPVEGEGFVPVQLEAPVVRKGEEVARAIFSPVMDPETREWTLQVKVQW